MSKGKATVKGLEVIATEERIAEVIGFPVDGENYPASKDTKSTRSKFTEPNDPPLSIDKQGVKRMSLPEPWKQIAIYVIKYITCEGRQLNFHFVHFKILNHMRHRRRMNVSNMLYNLLSIMVAETHKGRDNFLSHHCLIKLLVEKSLHDVSGMTWEEFIKIN